MEFKQQKTLKNDKLGTQGWHAANEMRNKQKYCDFTLTSNDGKSFSVHRIILASVSPYFDLLFNVDMREKSESLVSFPVIDSTTLSLIVKYIYTGEIQINDENVQLVYIAAHYFQIEWIVEKCEEYLKAMLNTFNWWTIYKLADCYSGKNLFKYCQDYMVENFNEFILRKTYLEMPYEQFNSLISRNIVTTELNFYTAIIDWVKHKPDQRKIHLQDLLAHVDLGLIESNFLLRHIMKEPILRSDDQCRNAVKNFLQQQLYPEDVRDLENSETAKLKFQKKLFIPHEDGCQMYNLPHFNLIATTQMITKRREFGTVYAKKKVFMFGGKDMIGNDLKCIEAFDPFTQLWSSIGQMPSARCTFGTCVVGDSIYLCGGYHINKNQLTAYNTVDIYNLETCEWTKGVAATFDGYVKSVFLSNVIYCSCFDGILRFDPREGRWTRVVRTIPTFEKGLLVTDDNWNIYRIGSENNLRYDIRNDKSDTLPDLKIPRIEHGAILLKRRVHVFGGKAIYGARNINVTEIYDPVCKEWLIKDSVKLECRLTSTTVLYST